MINMIVGIGWDDYRDSISFPIFSTFDATSAVGVEIGQGLREVDVKKYIMVEKVPGGQLEDSKVKGVMINKDVIAPSKMRIKNVNPRIILLDCPLEYKKVIVNRPKELQESNVGTGAGLFEVKKIGDEFFAFIVDCKDPKSCTVLLRGASKDLLNEVERNLQDAISAARNIMQHPKLVPGGGAAELIVSAMLKQKSSSVEGIEKTSLLTELFIWDCQSLLPLPSNCHNEEQREVYRVEQPPERGVNDTAREWVSTRSGRISVVNRASSRWRDRRKPWVTMALT
nr:T-complex protein 1 subunit gamma-like [Ipomoea batatas]